MDTHDTLLCFTSTGKIHWLKVYQLPVASHASRGKPIVNLLPLEKDERVSAVLPVRVYPDNQFVFFATRKGIVKKTPLAEYSRPRANGIRAIELAVDDELVNAFLTNGEQDIMLFSSSGKCIRFADHEVRPMGRAARGVIGIRLKQDQNVVSMLVVGSGDILTVTENGFGKRTRAEDYPSQGRGGQGLIGITTSDRNGSLVGAKQVDDEDDVMLISDGGTLVRTCAREISTLGRNTQGVTLIRLREGEKLVGLARIETEEKAQQGADVISESIAGLETEASSEQGN